MKKFFLKLFLLGLPFILYYGIAFGVLLKSGELHSADDVVALQKEHTILFGQAYQNPDKYYKLTSAIGHKPEVLALGTSRIMQIRDVFFRDKSRFYNAGGGADHIGLYKAFREHMPKEALPKVLIISCDQFH